jgi:RimJ/RimL family protein N-acetyltransferase
MTSPYWPLTRLRLRTPRLELRWPTAGDLDTLAALALDGVHDPAVQPFGVAWTDVPASELPSRTLRYFWGEWGAWRVNDWNLHLVVAQDGTVIGTQAVRGRDFAILREVGTGSWLGRRHQGHGLGTEMRAAVLWLAFSGLGAQYALSTAHRDNAASLAVSRKLGYANDGIERLVVRGRPVTAQRLRLDRATWQARCSLRVEMSGLEPCLPWFGLARAGAA